MATTTIRQGDRNARLRETLALENGTAPDLTGARVRVHVRRLLRRPLIVDAAAAVEDAPNGVVAYSLTSADLATAGTLQVEWEVSFANGEVRTFPLYGWSLIEVLPRVGPAPEPMHGATHRARLGIAWAAGVALAVTAQANLPVPAGSASSAGDAAAVGIAAGGAPRAGASAAAGFDPTARGGATTKTEPGGATITTRTPRYSAGATAHPAAGSVALHGSQAAVRLGVGAAALAGRSDAHGAAPAASGVFTYRSEATATATGGAQAQGWPPIAKLPGQFVGQSRPGLATGSGISPDVWTVAPRAVALGAGASAAAGHAPQPQLGASGSPDAGGAQSAGRPPVIGNGRQLVAQAQRGSATTAGEAPDVEAIAPFTVQVQEGGAAAAGLEPTVSAIINSTAPTLTAGGDGTVAWIGRQPAPSSPILAAVGDGTITLEAA